MKEIAYGHLHVLAVAVLDREQQPVQVVMLCGWFVPHLRHHLWSWFEAAVLRYTLQASEAPWKPPTWRWKHAKSKTAK